MSNVHVKDPLKEISEEAERLLRQLDEVRPGDVNLDSPHPGTTLPRWQADMDAQRQIQASAQTDNIFES